MKSVIPLAAPGLLGRMVNSPAVQAYLKNQRTTNLMNQLMTWRQAAARGGLIGAMNQQQQPGQQQTATPVSPMMLNRARAQARGDESETAGLPALSRQNASIGVTAGAPGPRGFGRLKTGRPTAKIDWGEYKRIKEMGLNDEEAAAHLKVSRTALYEARKREGQSLGPTTAQDSPGTMTRHNLAKIKEYFDQGLNNQQIADKYGVSKERIHQIRTKYGYPQQPRGKPSSYGGSDE